MKSRILNLSREKCNSQSEKLEYAWRAKIFLVGCGTITAKE